MSLGCRSSGPERSRFSRVTRRMYQAGQSNTLLLLLHLVITTIVVPFVSPSVGNNVCLNSSLHFKLLSLPLWQSLVLSSEMMMARKSKLHASLACSTFDRTSSYSIPPFLPTLFLFLPPFPCLMPPFLCFLPFITTALASPLFAPPVLNNPCDLDVSTVSIR